MSISIETAEGFVLLPLWSRRKGVFIFSWMGVIIICMKLRVSDLLKRLDAPNTEQ